MNSDDITQLTTPGDEDKSTQPTITAVFRLLQGIKQDVENLGDRLDATNARLDGVEARLGGIEVRLDGIEARLDGIDARLDATNARIDNVELQLEALNLHVVDGFRDLSNKIDALNRSRLQTEADYIGLHQRVSELESKAT